MPLSNMAVRDIETVIHPYTNLARHREVGPTILNEGRGIYLYDDSGKRYIEGMAGLWCTALGYGNAGDRRRRRGRHAQGLLHPCLQRQVA